MPTFRRDLREMAMLAFGIVLLCLAVSEIQSWIATLPHDHVAVAINDGVKMFFGLTEKHCR